MSGEQVAREIASWFVDSWPMPDSKGEAAGVRKIATALQAARREGMEAAKDELTADDILAWADGIHGCPDELRSRVTDQEWALSAAIRALPVSGAVDPCETVPSMSRLHLDLRVMPGARRNEVEREVERIAALLGVGVHVKFNGEQINVWPPRAEGE